MNPQIVTLEPHTTSLFNQLIFAHPQRPRLSVIMESRYVAIAILNLLRLRIHDP